MRSTRAPATALVLGVSLLAGCTGPAGSSPAAQRSVSPVSSSTVDSKGLSAVERYRSSYAAVSVAEPVRLRIPSIGVTTTFERLGRLSDGTIAVPRSFDRAGWWTGGPRPGARGPAVVLGHVDSRTGPAVFYRLRELRRDAVVFVDRADGTVARFAVERLQRVPKRRFPTEEVYFPSLDPTLRLVTCGGDFDSSTGHYVDNVIAYATLVP